MTTASNSNWLVATDIAAIQSYLLSTVHLNTIAGASQVVVEADAQLLELAEKLNGRGVLASGGIGLFAFADEQHAMAFLTKVPAWYVDFSISGHVFVSDKPVKIDDPSRFGERAELVFRLLEQKKRRGFRSGETLAHPRGQPCESCGMEAAEAVIPLDDRWLGPACLRKYMMRNRHRWLEKIQATSADLRWEGLDPRKHLAIDFANLAGFGDLGVVVMDVDGTGELLKALQNENEDRWTAFSQGLADLIPRSLMAAVEATGGPFLDKVLEGKDCLPIMPLFYGGDDIVVVCRGDLALPLTQALTEHFTDQIKAWLPAGHKAGISAGVAITRPGFPFRMAHQIATELCSNAKHEARSRGWRKEGCGAIDYAVITESMADVSVILDDRLVSSPAGNVKFHLTGRPFKCAKDGCRSIGGFRKACKTLAKFPRSRLHELRAMFTNSVVTADRKAKDNDAVLKAGIALQEKITHWQQRTCRHPDLKVTWQQALKELGLGDSCWYDEEGNWTTSFKVPRVGEGNNSYRTPIGDLADSVRLWGEAT